MQRSSRRRVVVAAAQGTVNFIAERGSYRTISTKGFALPNSIFTVAGEVPAV